MRAFGLPNGAPPGSCEDLMPRHPGSSHQETYPPPYQVLPAAGQGRVRLILGSPHGLAYEGFMILARDSQTGEFVGEFANLPDLAKIVECTPDVKVSAHYCSRTNFYRSFPRLYTNTRNIYF